MITQKRTWRSFKTSADILKPQWCSTRLELAQNCTLWKHDVHETKWKGLPTWCNLTEMSIFRHAMYAFCETNHDNELQIYCGYWLPAAFGIPFWSVITWFTQERFTVVRGRGGGGWGTLIWKGWAGMHVVNLNSRCLVLIDRTRERNGYRNGFFFLLLYLQVHPESHFDS